MCLVPNLGSRRRIADTLESFRDRDSGRRKRYFVGFLDTSPFLFYSIVCNPYNVYKSFFFFVNNYDTIFVL